MAAPAVPAAGAGVEAIAGLFLFVAFLLLIGLQQTWRATVGWIFHKLADLLDSVSFTVVHVSVTPFGFVAHALRAASDNVYAALGFAALQLEHSAVWLFHQAERQIKWIGHEIASLAQDTYQGINDLITREIPGAIHAATRPIVQRLHGIDRTISRLDRLFHEQIRRLTHGIDRLTHIVTRTIPHELDAIRSRAGSTSRQLRRLARRTSSLERAFAGAAFAAAVATALSRLGLRWLRCPALGRIGRKIGCGGFSFLEAFFAEAFEAMVFLDLCRFALAAQQLARFIVPQLGDLLLLESAICLGGGATLPSAHDSPKLTTRIELPTAHD